MCGILFIGKKTFTAEWEPHAHASGSGKGLSRHTGACSEVKGWQTSKFNEEVVAPLKDCYVQAISDSDDDTSGAPYLTTRTGKVSIC